MSQGMSTAPSTFQSFIMKIIEQVGRDDDSFEILAYMDDINIVCVKSKHNKVVEKILSVITSNNLVIALSKSEFFKTKINFLGYIIDESGVSVSSKKVEILLQLDYPKSAKDCMRILRALNYYCRSVKMMQATLQPIAKGSAMGKNFELTQEMKTALDEAKAAIRDGIHAHHLSYENDKYGRYVFVCSDASLTRIGGCIGNVFTKYRHEY